MDALSARGVALIIAEHFVIRGLDVTGETDTIGETFHSSVWRLGDTDGFYFLCIEGSWGQYNCVCCGKFWLKLAAHFYESYLLKSFIIIFFRRKEQIMPFPDCKGLSLIWIQLKFPVFVKHEKVINIMNN